MMPEARLDEIAQQLERPWSERELGIQEVTELLAETRSLRALVEIQKAQLVMAGRQALREAADELEHSKRTGTQQWKTWASVWLRQRARRVETKTVRGRVQDAQADPGEGS